MACRCMFQRPIRSSAVASRSLLQNSKAVRSSFGGTVTKVQARHLGHHSPSSQRQQRCFTKLTNTSSIINTVPSFRDTTVYQSGRYLYFLSIFFLTYKTKQPERKQHHDIVIDIDSISHAASHCRRVNRGNLGQGKFGTPMPAHGVIWDICSKLHNFVLAERIILHLFVNCPV